ncbi:hypothetical protein AMURIS_05130 [Acetatifactor muris]|uniref:Uncharacterized protein n=1 Tax=Acetatifactor muris TaxID=879566 RepID=A0A2K4ZPT3_9FIRM|nr:hypothetical protein AMURIS_05130 [Acetatifactor muris]
MLRTAEEQGCPFLLGHGAFVKVFVMKQPQDYRS